MMVFIISKTVHFAYRPLLFYTTLHIDDYCVSAALETVQRLPRALDCKY